MPDHSSDQSKEAEKSLFPSFRNLLLDRATSDPVYGPIYQQLKSQLAKEGRVDKERVKATKQSFSKVEQGRIEEERDLSYPIFDSFKHYSKQIIAEIERLSSVYSSLIALLLSLDDPYEQILLGRVYELAEHDYQAHLPKLSSNKEFQLSILLPRFAVSPYSHLEEHHTSLNFFFGKTIPPEFFDYDLWDELNFKTFFEAWFDSESCKYEYLFKRFLCGPARKFSLNPFDYYKTDFSTMWELIPLIVAQAKLDSGLQNPDELFQRAVELFETNSYTTGVTVIFKNHSLFLAVLPRKQRKNCPCLFSRNHLKLFTTLSIVGPPMTGEKRLLSLIVPIMSVIL